MDFSAFVGTKGAAALNPPPVASEELKIYMVPSKGSPFGNTIIRLPEITNASFSDLATATCLKTLVGRTRDFL
jgi:hypothetical protein